MSTINCSLPLTKEGKNACETVLCSRLVNSEDCFHLSHSLPYLVPGSDDYQESLQKLGPNLVDIFHAYAETRQPRTSTMVKGARAQGQTRVVTTGPEDCVKRDEKVATGWKDVGTIAAKYDALCREPFQGAPS